MKAIGIKMVELQPMTAREANDKGHRIGNHSFEEEGYEVTYPDGYKSWSPKDVAEAAYYPLSENNDGTKILKEDVENFIVDVETMKVGDKTTVVNAHTRSGFDMVRHSSCVDPKNYDDELGKKYALEEVVNDLWGHLGFVLQWAKFGIIGNNLEDKYSADMIKLIKEYKGVANNTTELANFINNVVFFGGLQDDEKEDLKSQLMYMHKYVNVLADRLRRQDVEPSKL